MNCYELKIQAKKERFEALAVSNLVKADEQSEAERDALARIPFGQPILIGHHSERAGRSYRARACGMIGRSVETGKKADYYAEKALNVGTAGISSDDPDAIAKLREKLTGLEAQRETYKAENKANKASGEPLLPRFYLVNLGANIRTVKERIERMEKSSARPDVPDVVGASYILRENKDANRLQFLFPGKPSDTIRACLKSHGFRWSPMAGAWQAFLTDRSRYQANLILKSF